MSAIEIHKPSIMEVSKVERAAKLRVFKRALTLLLKEHQMDSLTGVHDAALAEYLVMNLMSITKLMDNIYEFEKAND